MKKMECLRCHGTMEFVKTEELQLGRTGWILGDLSNLLAGALTVSIYACSDCGKLEFFQGVEEETPKDKIAQITCPKCGRSYDMDYPSCPFCKVAWL